MDDKKRGKDGAVNPAPVWMRSEQEANRAIELYADMIKRICFLYVKSYHDTEDIFQTVFLKYVTHDVKFESAEHEKAWFIRVAVNCCKDVLKSSGRRRSVSLDGLSDGDLAVYDKNSEILDAVLSLPKKYKDVVYLHYYEGYTAAETAEILHKNQNTVYTLLSRARTMLKEKIGGAELG